jgi:hypothetical protein
VISLLVVGQHTEGLVLLAGPFDFVGGDGAHAVGVEQEYRHILQCKALLAPGILGLSGNQDGREIQLIYQVQRENQLVIF